MIKLNKNIVALLLKKFAEFVQRISKLVFLVTLILLSTIVKAQFNNTDTLLIVSGPTNTNDFVSHKDNRQGSSKAEESFISNLLQKNFISGDWLGFRNTLSEYGLDFELVYKGEMFSNISGGFEKGTSTLDNTDIILSTDLEKSIGLKNTSFTIHFIGNSGGSPCELTGAAQGISNIETVPTWKLYQFLLEKKFFNNQISILAGLYDINSEFDTRESSSIFINPSHGIGPEFAQSGLNGPSIFPNTSLAVRLKFESEDGNYFQTAVLDGIPGDPDNPYGTHILLNKKDGLLVSAELGIMKNLNELLDSKIALGGWTYTNDFEKNDFTDFGENIISLENNYGFYLSAEKLLVTDDENKTKNLSAFLRIGYANTNVNPVDLYFGAGLKTTGLFNGRDDDEAGLSLAYAHNSSLFIKSLAVLEDVAVKTYELIFEVTYLLHLTPWLIIQPDIQYIINPSYCSQSENAFVLGSRMQLIF